MASWVQVWPEGRIPTLFSPSHPPQVFTCMEINAHAGLSHILNCKGFARFLLFIIFQRCESAYIFFVEAKEPFRLNLWIWQALCAQSPFVIINHLNKLHTVLTLFTPATVPECRLGQQMETGWLCSELGALHIIIPFHIVYMHPWMSSGLVGESNCCHQRRSCCYLLSFLPFTFCRLAHWW